jgi:Cdc6-like AAA superfamily ATPase
MIEPLPVQKLRNVFDAELVACSSTYKLMPIDEIFGQDRAQKALRFGLNILEKGFNIYVAGIPGTGRRSAVGKFLKELAKGKPSANDWVYVNNFGTQYEPLALQLPRRKGC